MRVHCCAARRNVGHGALCRALSRASGAARLVAHGRRARVRRRRALRRRPVGQCTTYMVVGADELLTPPPAQFLFLGMFNKSNNLVTMVIQAGRMRTRGGTWTLLYARTRPRGRWAFTGSGFPASACRRASAALGSPTGRGAKGGGGVRARGLL
jgi:hypothetical protein